MKNTLLVIGVFFTITSCNYFKKNSLNNEKGIIISKKWSKTNEFESDTLWVSQKDTTVFVEKKDIITRPCSNPELITYYELIQPKDSTYYFIYNNNQQLIKEGKYTYEYTYHGAEKKLGNFYNSKTYYYKNNSKLDVIHYQEDGRNIKTEYFDSKKRLSKIIFINKKSGETSKIEIYQKGILKETRNYTSFNNYTVIKNKNILK